MQICVAYFQLKNNIRFSQRLLKNLPLFLILFTFFAWFLDFDFDFEIFPFGNANSA